MRRLVMAAVIVGGLLGARAANAYPIFQLTTGAARCNQCHLAPAGGTLISSYGRDEAGDTVSRAGSGAFLHGVWSLPDWVQLGGDVRVASVAADNGNSAGAALHVFPMQADLYSNFKLKDFSATIVLGYRGSVRGEATQVADRFGSREHYLMWRPKSQGPYARAGKFRLPYGLRLPEHPYYVNRWGWSNLESEPYALSGGVVKNAYEWHASIYMGDPIRGVGDGALSHGLAGYYERRVGEKLVVGGQTRFGQAKDEMGGWRRFTFGAVAKYWLEGPKILAQAQLDFGMKDIKQADYTNKELLAYLGVTWVAARGVYLTGSGETFVEDLATSGTTRAAGNLELQYFPYAHVEVIGLGRITEEASMGMLQVHYYL